MLVLEEGQHLVNPLEVADSARIESDGVSLHIVTMPIAC